MLLDKIKQSHIYTIKTTDYKWWFWPIIILWKFVVLLFIVATFILTNLIKFIFNLAKKYKFVRIFITVVLTLCVLGIFDFFLNNGKIYQGTYIGDIDVSNKTIDEATKLIEDRYTNNLNNNTVTIYSNLEAQKLGKDGILDQSINEQINFEEAKDNVKYWDTSSSDLEAYLPASSIAEFAYSDTRGINNIFKRLSTNFFSYHISPWAEYNSNLINTLINKINTTLGVEVKEPSILFNKQNAYIIEGETGNLINNDEFTNQLNEAFFKQNSNESNFSVNLYEQHPKISDNQAQFLADSINKRINQTFKFKYNDMEYTTNKQDLINWLTVSIETCGDSKSLHKCIKAYIENNKIYKDLLGKLGQEDYTDNLNLKFIKEDETFYIETNTDYEIPKINTAVNDINSNYFKDCVVYEDTEDFKLNDDDLENVDINIQSTKIPQHISIEEAQNLCLINKISSYTTTYSTGAGSENRNHNIELAAKLLNNSIIEANGGVWSFNQIAGNCNEENGFLKASSVIGSTYTKEAGGGICQVATTVFNCVYDSGLKIVQRKNHDLYIASYPQGRDAAISWPQPDLKWANNTSSDILMQVTTNGYSVTCTLLGVKLNYKVETKLGDLKDTEPYTTEIVVDPTLSSGTAFIQTTGSNGKNISCIRNVYDKYNNLVISDNFISEYKPKTEIKVIGPGDEADNLLKQNLARYKNENDAW